MQTKHTDQIAFEHDIKCQEFLDGVRAERWGIVDSKLLPDGFAWPKACFWLRATKKVNAPCKFYIMIDVRDYPVKAPTGSFWDISKGEYLDKSEFPKGKPGSIFALVFRTDWPEEPDRAFYHYFDRKAVESHSGWDDQSDYAWTRDHTIATYLTYFQRLLTGEDYEGI